MNEVKELEVTEVVESKTITIDTLKVESLTKEIEGLRKEFLSKEYIVSMTPDLLGFFINFMEYQVPWKGREGFGVMEIRKKLESIKNAGIKDNSIYLTSLHIEATHYFLGKYEGKGSDFIDSYVDLYRNIEAAKQLTTSDNIKLATLEKELTAAQQGLETC